MLVLSCNSWEQKFVFDNSDTLPVLSKGICSVDSLTFSLDDVNDHCNDIYKYGTYITGYDTVRKKKMFVGRVIDTDESMAENGSCTKNVTCEGALGFLNDVRLYNITLSGSPNYIDLSGSIASIVESLLNIYNAKVPTERQIQLGNVDILKFVTEAVNMDWEDGITILDFIHKLFYETYKYEYRIRYEDAGLYLDVVTIPFGSLSNQTIALSENLITISKKTSTNEFATRIIPLSGKGYYPGQGTDDPNRRSNMIYRPVSSVDYVDNDDLVSKYGVIEKVTLYDDLVPKGTATYQRIVAALKVLATLEAGYLTEPGDTYTLSVLDLSKVPGNNVSEIELYNSYQIIQPIMHIITAMRVTEIKYDYSTPDAINEITFGPTLPSIARQVNK